MDLSVLDDLSGMTEEQRENLSRFLEVQLEYREAATEMIRLQLAALNEGTEAARIAARSHAEDVLMPLRAQLSEAQKPLVMSAVDVDYIKALPAMFGMALLSNGVNIPMLLAAIGADTGMVEGWLEKITDRFDW